MNMDFSTSSLFSLLRHRTGAQPQEQFWLLPATGGRGARGGGGDGVLEHRLMFLHSSRINLGEFVLIVHNMGEDFSSAIKGRRLKQLTR